MSETNDPYDLVLIGSGFASSFFLHEALRHLPSSARVLVLERGEHLSHARQLQGESSPQASQFFENSNPDRKRWVFFVGFGGGSNCWWACTPRMLPEDFELASRYGVGVDWPVSYDELEPYYCETEDLMAVSGPSDDSPFPRSRPYPQPPHGFSDVDLVLKKAFPDSFFHQPCARPTQATANGRPPCCGSSVCRLCPIDSKFTVQNELAGLFQDPRVTVAFGARVEQVEVVGDVARGVQYIDEPTGKTQVVRGDLFVLGANALFNPYLLLRSGLSGPEVGRGLVEQVSVGARIHLDGLNNFQGGTAITGHSYLDYGGVHRRDRAACLIETWNAPTLRDERGKWRQVLEMKLVFEDFRQQHNRVHVSEENPDMPCARHIDRSPLSNRGLEEARNIVDRLIAPLPVESVSIKLPPNRTESHIMGTTVMGNDPKTSVVDGDLLHHRVRNLVVPGSGVFPTASPANPTLTLSALSMRSARRILGS